MRSKITIIIVLLVIAAIVIGLYFYKHHENYEALLPKGPKQDTIVSFSTAKMQSWPIYIQSIGSISSKIGVTLRAQLAGRITKINYPSGDLVKKDSVLFVIYPKVLEAELQQAKSQVILSKFLYGRMKSLEQEEAVSVERFVQAESKLKSDQAKVLQIEQRLTLTNTYAPFNGVVGLTKVNVGDYVLAGAALATFQASDRLRVDFAVPQNLNGKVKKNDIVLIQTDVNSNKQYRGKIYAINPEVNVKTRMLDLRADIGSHDVLPGMFANVILTLDRDRQALVVPQTAVVASLHGDYVYTVKNHIPTKVFVKVGSRHDDLVAITEGLKAGDVVVSAGQVKIQPGDKVTDKNALIVKSTVQTNDGP